MQWVPIGNLTWECKPDDNYRAVVTVKKKESTWKIFHEDREITNGSEKHPLEAMAEIESYLEDQLEQNKQET